MKLLMINDISMVSSNMWTDTDARFSEVFSASTDLSFTGLTISDYHQLPPVKGRFIFSRFTREVRRISCCQKWHLFKYVELTEVSVLNNFCPAIVDRNTEKFLKVRFINQSGDNCPIDALHMYPENAPTVLRNQTALNNLPFDVYSEERNNSRRLSVFIFHNSRSSESKTNKYRRLSKASLAERWC